MKWWPELKYLIRKLNRKRAEQEPEEEVRAHSSKFAHLALHAE